MTRTVRLTGKRVLITGAGSGIGRAAALRLRREGASVAALDVDGDGLGRLAAEDPSIETLAADIGDEEQVAGAVAEAERRLGGLDTIVANAGIQLFGPNGDRPVVELPLEVWQHTLDINLTGTFLTCKHGIAAVLRAGGGSVVCTASPTGLYGVAPDFTAYSSSKGGVSGLVRVLAAGYGRRGVRVNAVIPGLIATPLITDLTDDADALAGFTARIPLGRPGTAEDVAGAIAFLVSDDASYATGSALVIDGGLTAI